MKQKDLIGVEGYVPLTIKSFEVNDNDESIEISGFANLSFAPDGTPIPDSDSDTILPIGIDLDRFKLNPIMLYNHNRDKMVGSFTEVEQRAEGLWVRGTVHKALNKEVYEAVRLGVLKTFSIGFRGLEGRWIDDDYEVYLYTKTELFEISVVTVPAAAQSTFGVVKMDCGSSCLAIKQDNTKIKTKEFEDMNKSEIEELLKSFKADLLKELGESGQLAPEKETPTSTVVEKEVEQVVEKELSLSDALEVIKGITLDEDNFNEVVGAVSAVNDKVNDFLNTQI